MPRLPYDMEINRHGGKCCGIRHVYNFPDNLNVGNKEYYETDGVLL